MTTFVDDVGVIGTGRNTDILKSAINTALTLVSINSIDSIVVWINGNALKISVSKTFAIILTNQR